MKYVSNVAVQNILLRTRSKITPRRQSDVGNLHASAKIFTEYQLSIPFGIHDRAWKKILNGKLNKARSNQSHIMVLHPPAKVPHQI